MSRKTLGIYLVCEPETPELARAAVESGADMIELGFPFSDPLADGPVIQRASERALARGMRTAQCLECLAATRGLVGDAPILPMTYAALLEAYGWERFATDAAAAGATSMIVSDVPAGQRPELPRVHLVAPTSTDERIRLAAASTDGWLYLVTLTGTTGARAELSSSLEGLVARTRPLADGVPLYAGFGISTPEHAAAAGSLADGIVVGSRAVQVAEDGPSALGAYVASLRDALDAESRSYLVDANALPAPRAAGATLREEEALRLGNAVPEDPAEVRLHGSGPTRTSIFPMFAPSSIPMNASGARSMPSTIVSR